MHNNSREDSIFMSGTGQHKQRTSIAASTSVDQLIWLTRDTEPILLSPQNHPMLGTTGRNGLSHKTAESFLHSSTKKNNDNKRLAFFEEQTSKCLVQYPKAIRNERYF